jgi:hypothetical protein
VAYRRDIKKIMKILEELNLYIWVNVLKNEQIKLIICFQDEVEKYLKKTVIIILQKLIKNLCKTIKVIALTDKCNNCE